MLPVHDNFITTTPYVKRVPSIYTRVYHDMGHPLNFINNLIKINLIDPEHDSYPQEVNNLLNHIPNDNEPISSDILLDFLYTTAPNKNMNKYILIVDEMVSYYQNYVNTVCGPSEKKKDEKWRNFKNLLISRSNNYSLHY